MSDRIKPLLGALVAGYIVFFVAATYLYQPVAAPPAMDPLVPNWLSLAIGLVLLVLFFDWMNQAVGNPMKSGIIIAVSQILLVDCLYVLNGNRDITAAPRAWWACLLRGAPSGLFTANCPMGRAPNRRLIGD